MKKFMPATILISLCVAGLGAVSQNLLQFKKVGFSIQPLEDQLGKIGYQALVMSLPPSGGFASNVNVQIQPYDGTMREYVTLSKKQFIEAKLELVKETRLNETSVILECTGEFQKRKLHWYTKVTLAGETIYLATATATETQWRTNASKLKSCVDSLAIGKK